MALSAQSRPEPMNSSPYHSKVKVTMTIPNPIFVAGTHVSGKMEVECRADKGLGISVMMVELFAYQELTSRDHSATSTFLHSRRLFQGPGLPPSNAVQVHPMPGDPPLPQHYHQARRGISTFLFRIPLPASAPASISFGGDLARVRYELRATVGVFWKGERRLVTHTRELDVVESYGVDFGRVEPEGVVVGEFGKIWVQGKVVGGLIVAGESACVELQVKNHSSKKNTGLTLVLSRILVLPGVKLDDKSALQISDVLVTVPFRGPEYIIHPGAEGVASLVFDVPRHARSVRGGTLEGDESEGKTSESLFEIQCILGLTVNMGIGTKDIRLDLPVPVVHPAALPEPEEYPPAGYPYPGPSATPAPYLHTPYAYPALPVSPPLPAVYIDETHNQVWLPPPTSLTPQPSSPQYFSSPLEGAQLQHQYYFPPPPTVPVAAYVPTRPLSAGPTPTDAFASNAHGIGLGPPPVSRRRHLDVEPEEGKGERAARVTQHLRLSSRHRSVSPMSHRFPLPISPQQYPHYDSTDIDPTVQDMWNLPLPSPTAPDAATMVHSPRPFLSPKHSYTSSLSSSLPRSERVEQLERMADEVGKAAVDLSSDLPKLDQLPPTNALAQYVHHERATPPLPREALESSDINKTLPAPPLPSIKELKRGRKETKDPVPQPRIDTYFSPAPTSELKPKAPPTPLAAVTPIKMPFKHKSSEFRTRLHPDDPNPGLLEDGEPMESGLDALERRLLAEVGTRKPVSDERRPDVRSVLASGIQPIDIPSGKVVPAEPGNDSVISSLALADEGLCVLEHELEVDRDSDEKTHRAGRSSGSGASRGRKSDGKAGKRRERGKEKNVEGQHVRAKKKSAAAKGRVTAWLGEIDPAVPPMEEVVPPSPAVARMPAPFSNDSDFSPTIMAGEAEGVVQDSQRPSTGDEAEKDEEISSVPDPRSSGFVPIGTVKHNTLQRRFQPVTKETSVVEEARRVTDIWSSPSHPAVAMPRVESSSAVKDASATVPIMSPAAQTPQSIRTDRRVSPPSTSAALDRLGAKHYKYSVEKSLQPSKPVIPPKPPGASPPKKATSKPSPRLPVFPPPLVNQDSEVKYDIRSARGGKGGRVTTIASIWASGDTTPEPKSKNPQSKLTADILVTTPKPLRPHPTELNSRDPLKKGHLASAHGPLRTPTKSLLTASAPSTNGEPKLVGLPGKRVKPVIKSSSVPALISSSHAIPTLSSTASLARPSPGKVRPPQVKISPTISEVKTDILGKTPVSVKSITPGGDLVFGQARLRDLIKKYQGT